MIIVFAAIGVTDLLFALDSIPAIFGITQSAFIVFTANLFALMGLRQLYFLLGGLLDRLRYLHYGIAFILAFIGVKLVFHAMHENELPFINDGEPILWVPDISTWTSLAVIITAMVVATVASLIAAGREDKAKARNAVAAGVVADAGAAGAGAAGASPDAGAAPTATGAAAVVADEKGTPPTVKHPDTDPTTR